jgi:hypothetical protein
MNVTEYQLPSSIYECVTSVSVCLAADLFEISWNLLCALGSMYGTHGC